MTHCRFSWVSPCFSWHGSLTVYCSYGLSLVDGDDSMDETGQISQQIFMREGKVYDKWYQLYPALLHLCVTADASFTTTFTNIPLTVTANRTTTSFGTIP